MKVVKFSPSSMTPAELSKQSRKCQTGLHDNPLKFPASPVSETQMSEQDGKVILKTKAQTDAFQLYAQASKELHEEVTIQGNQLLQFATYVDGVAISNMATAESTANAGGFPVVQSAHHSTFVPDTTIDLSVTQGDQSTYADYHFSPCHEHKADLYDLYYSLDVVDIKWVLGGSDKKSSGTVQSLPVKVPIAFMVRGKNGNGEAADGNVVIKTIL